MGQSRTYGWSDTIHRDQVLDITVDADGQVVAVWFRCQALPFRQNDADERRAAEMRSMYENWTPPKLLAVDLEDVD